MRFWNDYRMTTEEGPSLKTIMIHSIEETGRITNSWLPSGCTLVTKVLIVHHFLCFYCSLLISKGCGVPDAKQKGCMSYYWLNNLVLVLLSPAERVSMAEQPENPTGIRV